MQTRHIDRCADDRLVSPFPGNPVDQRLQVVADSSRVESESIPHKFDSPITVFNSLWLTILLLLVVPVSSICDNSDVIDASCYEDTGPCLISSRSDYCIHLLFCLGQ